jgi:hypothetical protein
MLLRCQGSILEAHADPDVSKADNRCHVCRTRFPAAKDVCEDAEHALLHCCKPHFAAVRAQFHADMAEQCDEFRAILPDGSSATWSALEDNIRTELFYL